MANSKIVIGILTFSLIVIAVFVSTQQKIISTLSQRVTVLEGKVARNPASQTTPSIATEESEASKLEIHSSSKPDSIEDQKAKIDKYRNQLNQYQALARQLDLEVKKALLSNNDRAALNED